MSTGKEEEFSRQSLKAVEDFVKKTEAANKSTQAMREAFGNISTQLVGISNASYFKQVPKTVEELKEGRKEVSKLKNDLDGAFKKVGDPLRKQFGSAIDLLEKGISKLDTSKFDDKWGEHIKDVGGSFRDLGDLQDRMKNKFGENSKEFNKFKEDSEAHAKAQKSHQEKYLELYEEALRLQPGLYEGLSEQEKIYNLSMISQKGFNELVREGDKSITDMAIHSEDVDPEIANAALTARRLKDEFEDSVKELIDANKEVFSLSNALKDMAKNFAGDILPNMLKYDQAVSDAGRNFGFIGMKTMETSIDMAILGDKAARFGMSVEETTAMMGSLGDKLGTIDRKYLTNAVGHFVAIEKATGASMEEITTIGSEMMMVGKSAEQVESYFEGANKTAKMLGVNTKKVLQGVARNIDKMRQMGFQGGEESLTRMVATAERLRMNVDSIFDVAKKARSIEGAMDMAAELQLAGGSFANIDPMSLLAAARKGPKELQSILTQMGGDIGRFNDDGEFEIDAIDADRMQMMADATSLTVDEISKMIQKNAEDNKKVDFLGLSSSIGDDERNFLSDMTKMKEDGTGIEMSDELSKLAKGAGISLDGVDSLADLNQDQIQELMKAKEADISNLEKQAEQNQSLTESIAAFKASLMNLFTIFEPVIAVFTDIMQAINSMPGPFKFLAAAIIGFVAIAPKLGMAMDGLKKGFEVAKGIGGKVKGLFSKAVPSDDSNVSTEATNIEEKASKNPGDSLKSLGEGLKAMAGKEVTQGIGNLLLATPVLILFIPAALVALPAMALAGTMHDQIVDGFEALALGLSAMSEGGVLSGIGALALSVIPLLLFTPVALIALPAMAVVGLLGELIKKGFSAVSEGMGMLGNNLANIAKGALALALVGASLIPFAIAAQTMTGVDWLSVLAGVGVIALVVLGLIGIGAMLSSPLGLFLAVGVVALIGVGAGLLLASVGLLAAGAAFDKLAQVDWGALSEMGSALMSSVPGLMAFSIASMAFLNPLVLFGMIAMTATLGALALVMVPLGAGMKMAADGVDRFAEGLAKLQAAANSLDLSKLESLKGLSASMSVAGSGGSGIGDQVDKIAEAIVKLSNSKSGEGKGGNRKIEIDLKLNGRQIKEMIIDDTEIVS